MPYLIDGHNLIGRWPGLRLDDPDDEQQLVSLLRQYLARVKRTGLIVFDRGQVGAPDNLSNHALKVVFARTPLTADDVLRQRLRRERNPRGLIVVTSDGAVAAAARQAGASVKDAAEFAREARNELNPAPQAGEASQKEQGLSAAEVAEWEEAFRKRAA